MSLLGTPVLRVEDPPLLRGEGTYIGGLVLPDMLHVGYVTSTIAHARITSIDTRAAAAASGVVDVITAADIDIEPLRMMSPAWPEAMRRPPLAIDTVRFVGEAVVGIAAESAATLADALELVEVDYEPLPTVVDAHQARSDEVLLYPEHGTNEVITMTGGADAELPFDECEVVTEGVFLNQRLAPCPIETRVAAAYWADDGRLVHYASCQGAHPIRTLIAQAHRLEPEQIRVIVPDVGGSFGAKARAYPEEILLAVLAKRTGRPVRWTPERSADMVGLGHSRGQVQTVRIGGDRDGTIRCLEATILADAGAYPVAGPGLANNTGALLPQGYRIPHVRYTMTCVVTNTTPVVAYRGAGRPESAALVDRAVDLFAAEIGLDPVEVRRVNLLRSDEMPWSSPTGLTYDSGNYPRALELALDAAGIDELRREQARRRAAGETTQLGIGLSSFIDRTAGIPGSEYGAVELVADGRLVVHTGSTPYGQGHRTAWSMLVSERTGMPIDRITVVHGDTDLIPRSGVTGGSRSAQKAGMAVAQATDALVVEAKQRAADILEASAEDVVLDIDAGRFHVAGAPGAAAVGWADLAGTLGDDEGAGALKCESDFSGEGPTFPFGTYLAVVDVDVETGFVRLQRLITVDDAGTILNPVLALGQVHGGAGQGIAQALFEEVVYDADGNPLTANLADYAVPSAADMPSFECQLTETPSPNNPLGFKGIAESGTIGAPPAIQNAVVDALSHLGVHHVDMPLTAERVWRAIQSAPALA